MHDRPRLDRRPLCLRAGRVPRLPAHLAGLAALAVAADAGSHRDVRHLGGRLAGGRRRRLRPGEHRARLHRRHRFHHQRGGRVPHHRPHPQDVPGRRSRRRAQLEGRSIRRQVAMRRDLLQLFYLLSAILFVLGLRGLSHPTTARRGMFLAEFGMLLAIVGSLLHHEIIDYKWIAAGLALGTLIGVAMSIWIPMTAVPQRTALSHSFGALAASLIGISEYYRHGAALGSVRVGVIGVEVMLGTLTFTGSLMAAGKLQGLIRGYPITYRGQNFTNIFLLAGMLALIVGLMFVPQATAAFYSLVGLAFFFGVLLILPIGAADMPVVIALLNSYAGLTDAAMGFMLDNQIQIITGSLDGSSGFILSVLMCRAMNRSITNVLFGAFGKVADQPAGLFESRKPIRQCSIAQAAEILGTARSVVFVPGYGLAGPQGQHRVRQGAAILQNRGAQGPHGDHAAA